MQIANDPLTQLVLTLFRANQVMLQDGDCLAARYQLTSAKWKVLGALAYSAMPLSAAAIGRIMGLSRQAAIKQINLLLEQGLLERQDNPADARAPLHQLTPLGEQLLTGLSAAWQQRVDALTQQLSPAQCEQARSVLETLIAQVETLPPSRRNALDAMIDTII